MDTEGCFFSGIILVLLGAFISMGVSQCRRDNSPEGRAEKQAIEQRAAEDRELAEWRRLEDIRAMRAEKAKPEESRQ